MSGFLQATLRATFGLVALLESARSTPGTREKWREALRLVLLVSMPMRLVHGRLALTFWASSCGGGGQALAWPDELQRGGVSEAGVTKSRRAVGVSVAMPGPRSLVEERQSQFTQHWWNSLRRLDCIQRPNGSQSRNGFARCLAMRPRGQAVRDGRNLAGLQVLWRRRRLHASDTGSRLALQRDGLCLPPLLPHGINRSKLVTCTYMHVRSLGAEVRVTASATTKHGLGVLSQILVSTNQGAMPCPQERWSQPCRTCGCRRRSCWGTPPFWFGW